MQPSKLFKKRLIAVAIQAAVYSMLLNAPTHAGPTGGEVVGAAGSMTYSGSQTTIQQTTLNMTIKSQSDNVNVNERAQYVRTSFA